jgi:hypothetical protein
MKPSVRCWLIIAALDPSLAFFRNRAFGDLPSLQAACETRGSNLRRLLAPFPAHETLGALPAARRVDLPGTGHRLPICYCAAPASCVVSVVVSALFGRHILPAPISVVCGLLRALRFTDTNDMHACNGGIMRHDARTVYIRYIQKPFFRRRKKGSIELSTLSPVSAGTTYEHCFLETQQIGH